MRKIILSRLVGASLALLLSVNAASAANYPDKPITMVVPFSPGGATDQLGRYLGQRLSDKLGQPVIIENRPGAGDRKSVVSGKSVSVRVDLGGRGIIKKTK